MHRFPTSPRSMFCPMPPSLDQRNSAGRHHGNNNDGCKRLDGRQGPGPFVPKLNHMLASRESAPTIDKIHSLKRRTFTIRKTMLPIVARFLTARQGDLCGTDTEAAWTPVYHVRSGSRRHATGSQRTSARRRSAAPGSGHRRRTRAICQPRHRDVGLWPTMEVAAHLTEVRLPRHGRQDLLGLSSSHFDPLRKWSASRGAP
jgi:hypothetical protein